MDVDRRRLLSLAGLGGAATLLSACGGNEKNKSQGPGGGGQPVESKSEPAESDVADVSVLNSALDLEYQAIAAYTLALKTLTGVNLRTARTFLEQEHEHAVRLIAAIKQTGGRPDAARKSYSFPKLRTQNDILRFASKLENTAIAAYIDAVPRLNDPDLRATTASIAATEAEHLAVLNQALGLRAAPSAFVTGAGAAA